MNVCVYVCVCVCVRVCVCECVCVCVCDSHCLANGLGTSKSAKASENETHLWPVPHRAWTWNELRLRACGGPCLCGQHLQPSITPNRTTRVNYKNLQSEPTCGLIYIAHGHGDALRLRACGGPRLCGQHLDPHLLAALHKLLGTADGALRHIGHVHQALHLHTQSRNRSHSMVGERLSTTISAMCARPSTCVFKTQTHNEFGASLSTTMFTKLRMIAINIHQS